MVSRRPRKCRYSIPSQFCMALLKTLWTLKLVTTFHTEAEFVRRWASYWGKKYKIWHVSGKNLHLPARASQFWGHHKWFISPLWRCGLPALQTGTIGRAISMAGLDTWHCCALTLRARNRRRLRYSSERFCSPEQNRWSVLALSDVKRLTNCF